MTTKCATCNRDPQRMNSSVAECSHVDCPARERAWSKGTPKPEKAAPKPIEWDDPYYPRDGDI